MRVACADEAFKFGACRVIGVGGALAQRVHAAVDIGAVVAFEMLQGDSTGWGICVVAALSR